MSKHQFLIWQLANNRVWMSRVRMKDKLSYEACKTCSFCQWMDETEDHLFFDCTITKPLWDKARSWLHISRTFNTTMGILDMFGQHYRGVACSTKPNIWMYLCTLYLIWQTRNRCQYKKGVPNIKRMFRKLQIHVFRFLSGSYVHP